MVRSVNNNVVIFIIIDLWVKYNYYFCNIRVIGVIIAMLSGVYYIGQYFFSLSLLLSRMFCYCLLLLFLFFNVIFFFALNFLLFSHGIIFTLFIPHIHDAFLEPVVTECNNLIMPSIHTTTQSYRRARRGNVANKSNLLHCAKSAKERYDSTTSWKSDH